MDNEDFNPDDIEFEDEDSTIYDFFHKPAKPLTYEQLLAGYEHIGIDINDYPKLKARVEAVREKSKKK